MVPLDEARPDGLGYRQSQNTDKWHYCSNCSSWPLSNYIELWVEPTSGKICSECERKRLEGSCQADIVPALYKQT